MLFNVDICKIIRLPKIEDNRGNLTVVEKNDLFNFDIKRVYYIYDVPAGSERGGHAHKELHQLIVAVSGSFDVLIDDGYSKKIFKLNRPYEALYVCPLIWREINNFSSGSVCLVMASNKYDEIDYFRNYTDFLKAKEII
jgi:dTDP-4-dehydrorhamnose 3,5-epimerase-like enzyme